MNAGKKADKERAEHLVKKALVSSELRKKRKISTNIRDDFTRQTDLSNSDKVLLEKQLPAMQGELVENNLRMMLVFRDLIVAEKIPAPFVADPIKYIEQETSSAIRGGEIAPGVIFDPSALTSMLKSARQQYAEGRSTLPDEVMAVHTSTSKNSYVRSEKRTSFTFEKSNITGTEKRAIASSETRTSTVTSGRGVLDVDMSNILIRPELLDRQLSDFFERFGDSEPDLNSLLDPGWTDPVKPRS